MQTLFSYLKLSTNIELQQCMFELNGCMHKEDKTIEFSDYVRLSKIYTPFLVLVAGMKLGIKGVKNYA